MSYVVPTRSMRRITQRKFANNEADENLALPIKDNGHNLESLATNPLLQPMIESHAQVTSSTSETSPDTLLCADLAMANEMVDLMPAKVLAIRPTTSRSPTLVRRSVRASRKSYVGIVPDDSSSDSRDVGSSSDLTSTMPTALPLSDITHAIVNDQPTDTLDQRAHSQEVVSSMFTKPMDLVVRARTKLQPDISIDAKLKSRIVLTYLILTNFKSYAGRQEVGPFHSSFSSVVGPNGSGKSNVIDSLLFVFGFRASKMRQGKLSALIHNSAAYPDLSFCEVEVRFQEVVDHADGSSETILDSQLVISRKAFKNNSSKYYLNGSESNFTAVTNLLRNRGVDLDHKRFLILQGEVESIAQMKPKASSEHDDGLLEYLEDIIGTSRFKPVIEELASKADTLNESCLEKSQRVQHVEKEKRALETRKNETLGFIKDENELSMKQSALYQVYIAECGNSMKTTEETLESLQSQSENEIRRHKVNEDAIRSLKQQHTTELKQFECLEQSMQTMLKQLAKLDREIVKYDEKKKHLAAKVKRLEKAKSSSDAGYLEAGAHLSKLAEDYVRNSKSISDIELRLDMEEQELVTIREKLQAKTQVYSDEINRKQKSLAPWTQQINDKRSAVALAKSELAILVERDQAELQAAVDIEQRLTRIRDAKITKTTEMEQYKSQQTHLEAKIRQLRTDLHNLAQVEPESKSRLASARHQADEARATLTMSQTQGNVLTGLMRLKQSGRIQGFHGRLGNLGTIDQKFDVAISTACPALDNLVVDSVEVGHLCIEYLRKNNLGRANIILLDRIAQRNLSSIETPEGIPRLFDLVKTKDDRFRPAFFNVLQNTLVAKDIEQANRVAYGTKRWRVVTLDGQLIDTSGTMSGGGSNRAKGKMSSKVVVEISKQQVENLESLQETLEQEFRDLQTERQSVEKELQELTLTAPTIDTQLQKLRLELDSCDHELADVERRHKESTANFKPITPEDSPVVSLDSTIHGLQQDIDRLLENTSGIETEISTLQEKIMEIGGVQLRSQKAKVDGLREQINTLNEEISGSEVVKAKIIQQKRKYEKCLADTESELTAVHAELQSLEVDINEQVRHSASMRNEGEELEEQLELKKDILSSLTTQLDQQSTDLNAMRGIELELRNRIEENRRHLDENQKRLLYWQEKLTKLTIHVFSDLCDGMPEPSLTMYTPDELEDLDQDNLKGDIATLEEKLQDVPIDFGVLSEYRQRVEELAVRSSALAEAVNIRDHARKECEELRRLRLEGFMEGFSTISLRLKEMYQMITMGGNAELELVDSLDPFSEGILFSVMPPKKSWKNISNLSGGEKTLSSLALVFALHHYKPTPLYVMDEIDAALDFRNVSIVASYIKERTKNAQFVVISLRNNMFELASRLVGVYKVNHMTKSITLENRDYIERQA